MSIINTNPTLTTVTAGASLKFLSGTQANLNALTTAIDGAIYLTTDTKKLYVGDSSNTLNELNQILIINGSSLTASSSLEGRFAYDVSSKGLFYCNGTNWVKLNEQTSISVTHGMGVTVTNNVATVSSSIDVSNIVKTATFDIEGKGGLEVTASGTKVIIDASNAGNQELSTASDGTNVANIQLSKQDGSSSTVGIQGGDNVTVSQADNVITVAAEDTYIKTMGVTSSGITGFKLNAAYNSGSFVATMPTIDPIIKVGSDTATTQEVHFESGTATLPVYTISEIDQKIRNLNAVVYRGVITANDTFPSDISSSTLQNGDLFLIQKDGITVDGKAYNAGDMIIASGTEDTSTGYITSGTVVWQYIENAKEVDTTYTVGKNNNGIAISDSNNTIIGGINVATGDSGAGGLTVTSAESGDITTVTLTHRTPTDTSDVSGTSELDVSTGGIMTYVSGLTKDSYGHVTGVNTSTLTLSGNDLQTVSAIAASEDNIATITTGVAMTSQTAKSSSYKIASGNSTNLMISTSGNATDGYTVTLDTVWGTF